MPTHVTYELPGHHGAGAGTPPKFVSITLIVHSQVTFQAPWVRNTVTMCRQAATNTVARVCRYPQENHDPFISWPKPMMTGRLKDRTAPAKVLRYPSYFPAAIAARLTCVGFICTSGTAPCFTAAVAKPTWNGSFQE